jgi:hypothetical protein
MKFSIAILVTLLTTMAAQAQTRDGFAGPLTGYEADLLSEVWPEIRVAEDFEQINWRAHGLDRAPASREAQRFLSTHWDELRREQRFSDIEWAEFEDRPSNDRAERYGRVDPYEERDNNASPFTREEAAALSRSWGHIREAARFEDIDWRAIGFSGAPGDRQARQLMSRHWGQVREAGRFEDIDWQAITGYGGR